jgi:hypothetical protein
VEFTPEFEELIRDIYDDVKSSDPGKAKSFLEAAERARQSLEDDPTLGAFYCYDKNGNPINFLPLTGFPCDLLYRPAPVNTIIWMEGFP